MDSTRIELKGIIVNKEIETEGRWKMKIDVSEVKRLGLYDTFYTRLVSLLTTVDSVWSERATERKVVHGEQYYRQNKESLARVKRNVIEFVVAPQTIVNGIKYIRSQTYNAINRYALKIPLTFAGYKEGERELGRKAFLYIVPNSLYPKLVEEIEKINRNIDDLNYRKGRKGQLLRENEVGEYSLHDFYSSPFWKQLKFVISGMVLLNELSLLGKSKLESLTDKEKLQIIKALEDGRDVVPVISAIAEKRGYSKETLERLVNDALSFVKDYERYLSHVKLMPMIADMSYDKLNEWASQDPAISKQLHESLNMMINGMVSELRKELKGLFDSARARLNSKGDYINLDSFFEDLNAIGDKLAAMGVGKGVIEDVVASLKDAATGVADKKEMVMNLKQAEYDLSELLDSMIPAENEEIVSDMENALDSANADLDADLEVEEEDDEYGL